MLMNTRQKTYSSQAGVMLLEALIAILIFSLGILSLVALQATTVQLTSDAKYRTDASLLADKLIGQMWASGGTLAALKTNFESPDGNAYKAWLQNDVTHNNALPGVVAEANGVVSTLPTVTVDATPGATAGQVAITLFWRTPQMKASEPGHRHVVATQIVFQN